MKRLTLFWAAAALSLLLSGCGIFEESSVSSAPMQDPSSSISSRESSEREKDEATASRESTASSQPGSTPLRENDEGAH